jgi:hypothetical protein
MFYSDNLRYNKLRFSTAHLINLEKFKGIRGLWYDFCGKFNSRIKQKGFPMLKRCKVCELPDHQKDVINTKLLGGVSYYDTEKWCKQNGLSISHMTLKRHFDSGHIANGGITSDVATKICEAIKFEPTKDELKNFSESVKERLKTITIQQLEIVRVKQQQFLDGSIRFPDREFSALTNCVSMCYQVRLIKPDEIVDKNSGNTLTTDMCDAIKRDIFGL